MKKCGTLPIGRGVIRYYDCEWAIVGKSLFCLWAYVASLSNVILSVSRRIPRKGTARLRHCSKKINQICEKLFLAHIYLFRFIALALRGRCFDCAVAPLNMTIKTWQCTNLCCKRAFYLHLFTYSPSYELLLAPPARREPRLDH